MEFARQERTMPSWSVRPC